MSFDTIIQSVLATNPFSIDEAVERALEIDNSLDHILLSQAFQQCWEEWRLQSAIKWLESGCTGPRQLLPEQLRSLAQMHLDCQDQLDAEIIRDLEWANELIAGK